MLLAVVFSPRILVEVGPLSCSFVQQHQLELRPSKTYSKRQNLVQNKNIDVPNLENRKHTKDPPFGVFHSDLFRHCDFFFDFFGLH